MLIVSLIWEHYLLCNSLFEGQQVQEHKETVIKY